MALSNKEKQAALRERRAKQDQIVNGYLPLLVDAYHALPQEMRSPGFMYIKQEQASDLGVVLHLVLGVLERAAEDKQ